MFPSEEDLCECEGGRCNGDGNYENGQWILDPCPCRCHRADEEREHYLELRWQEEGL